MDLALIEAVCTKLPHVESEIKWKSDLVFMIARKMFCLVDLEAIPTTVAFKVAVEDFDELSTLPYFKPAPYFAQHNWVTVVDIDKISLTDFQRLIEISYLLVKNRLSKKAIRNYGVA